MAGTEGEPEVDFELKERAMDEAPVGITISDPDREDNQLIYANEAFERLTGYPSEEILGRNCRFLQGEESDSEAVAAMGEAVAAEEAVTVELVNYRADSEAFWNEVTIAPLRDGDGEVTHFVGFQNDVTARKEAELEVERRKRDLEHLVGRINGLLEDVTETLMRSTSRAEDERGVTERLAAADPYAFAWFGELDLVAEAVVPSAWAGEGDALDGVAIDVDADDPTARAFDAQSIQTGVVDGTACADRVPGARSLAAVPVAYRDTVYGVLTVYSDEPDAFDERETVVLEALGRTVGTAINARESSKALTADNPVELEFGVRDRGLFFVDLSARGDCRLEYLGSVNQEGAALSMFFTTDAAPERIEELAADVPEVEDATLVSGDDESNLFEFRLADGTVVADLAERGAKTREMSAEGGTGRLILELPPAVDSRAIADLVRERVPGSELLAHRERDRPATTRGEFVAALGERLTDRQVTALQKAYFGGYYDPSRSTTGDELAESMGISRATFHQHLRAAERKLIGEFVDAGI
ncbi:MULTISPECIES: bacterio-opsin activator domain-containing protein [Halorussus]|uniref:bacterio-opsin activator domain-containing protein n=1 Tax=Halorussus TaxID=1070314 RepID=UPI000E2198D7|nr:MULTISPECIES: bacterio-opsin activator domain-containing protein [Halorussus]NHN60013.1 PAS domain-containing protein [Halorussus sp. JP-T4]